MSVVSTRVSIQWPPEESYENTNTLVLTTPGANFVDIRLLKEFDSDKNEFPIDWVITGVEYSIPNSSKIQFRHEISSHVPHNHGGEWTDIGDFSSLPDGDRKETGTMVNPATGKEAPYVEIWRTISALKLSEDGEYVKLKDDKEAEEENKNVKFACIKVDQDTNKDYLGTVVKIGAFMQGAILNLKTEEISLFRYFKSAAPNGEWTKQFAYGKELEKIPIAFGEKEIENCENVQWKLVESNF